MVKISSWGRLTYEDHTIVPIQNRFQAASQIARNTSAVAYGMGRSYGDACLNPNGMLWTTAGLDHYIAFDEVTGRLVCEAGVLLRDIQRMVVPRGWMLPVTPGTQIVTVGGAIANDVHGKNHHVHGSFGDHVLNITLLRTNGETIECGPDHHPAWFSATVGGIGLTGFILMAEIQLRRIHGAWLDTETIAYANLDEFFHLADSSEAGWEHTVSWIDCVSKGGGRGLFMRGNHTDMQQGIVPSTRQKNMPITPPISLVNQLSLRAFNTAYYWMGKCKSAKKIVHYEPFFYPLDNMHHWNRMYGPKGFFQYQCVVPRADGQPAIQAMLHAIAKSGQGSFLAVLKTFGNKPPLGMLSFPSPGVTLALDFPNQGLPTASLFERLDAIVNDAGGRIYLAKDARMPRKLFEAAYPNFNQFLSYRDPGISSAMSRRLMGF